MVLDLYREEEDKIDIAGCAKVRQSATERCPPLTNSLAEFWNARIKASGLRPSDTRIPDVPSQSLFLEQWFNWHQGYRIIRHEDGSEEQEALQGEALSEVDVGHLPRTWEELREHPSRQALDAFAFDSNHVVANTLETTALAQRPSEITALAEDRLFDPEPENESITSSPTALPSSPSSSHTPPTHGSLSAHRQPSLTTFYHHQLPSHSSLSHRLGMEIPGNMSSSPDQPGRPQSLIPAASTAGQLRTSEELSHARRLIFEIDDLFLQRLQVDFDHLDQAPLTGPVERFSRTGPSFGGASATNTENGLTLHIERLNRLRSMAISNSSSIGAALPSGRAPVAESVAIENYETIRDLRLTLQSLQERLTRNITLLERLRGNSEALTNPHPAAAQPRGIARLGVEHGRVYHTLPEAETALREPSSPSYRERPTTMTHTTPTLMNEAMSPGGNLESTNEGVRRHRTAQTAQLADATSVDPQGHAARIEMQLGSLQQAAHRLTQAQSEARRQVAGMYFASWTSFAFILFEAYTFSIRAIC